MRRHDLKEHEVAQLVNSLTACATKYHNHQSLRIRLATVLQSVLNPMELEQDQDVIPIRLPSGSKAVLILPRPFTKRDAPHFMLSVAQYIEDEE